MFVEILQPHQIYIHTCMTKYFVYFILSWYLQVECQQILHISKMKLATLTFNFCQ